MVQFIKRNSHLSHVFGSCKTKWIPVPLGRCQRIPQGGRGNSLGCGYLNATRYRKLLYVLDQVRATTCSRGQHFIGGKGGVLICIRMNVDYGQTASKEGLQKEGLGPA